ncbi:hypothetical protein NQT69_03395 [Pseudoalteromonas shioyasakiensis]|uniref:hypothetical protein n=1 Tax=Pseudoalteromonas shioyasakiensis TaxID=1190813 RepID=UPI002117AE78|nr:hypothetical protein [Pseudoalteromonas shioyasakiensis]MCQ8877083.1 hypothetical protein [Pseudoalteromonas shioyasakiensis]
MKFKVLSWVGIGLFVIFVFVAGLFSGALMTFQMNGASYTKEHVDNGRFFLYALKKLEDKKDVDGAISTLRNGLFAKVAIVGVQLELLTNNRDKELIESFYFEVIDYLNQHGGLYDTYQVIENDKSIEKQSGHSMFLQEFAEKHSSEIK